MFQKEREDAILQLLESNGRVAVTDLAQRFDVTEDCIRKDLRRLDGQGLLERVHGGAVPTGSSTERDVAKRIGTNEEQKRAIAKKAYDLIEDGSTVYLDVSTTNLALAELLARGDKRVTVISNMMGILHAVAHNPLLNVIGIGGAVNLELDGFVGAQALVTIEPLRFDVAFLGGLSVDLKSGSVTTYTMDDGLTKQLVIRNAAQALLMVDAHKFMQDGATKGNFAYAHVRDFDALVCDAPSSELASKVEALGSTLL